MADKGQTDKAIRASQDKAWQILQGAARLLAPGGAAFVVHDALKRVARKIAAPQVAAKGSPAHALSTAMPAPPPARQQRSWAERPLIATAEQLGRGAGVARGAWRTVSGIPDDLVFAHAMTHPFDPSGQQVRQQFAAGVVELVSKAQQVRADPQIAAQQTGDVLSNWNKKLNPAASPQALTLEGELRRRFGIAANQGKLGYDVASLFYGGAEMKALRGTRMFSNAPTVADYMARGIRRPLATYFAELYKGDGHHYWPRRQLLPEVLGGGPLPPAIAESPFFLLKPKGFTNGEFAELHGKVDPHVYGCRVPPRHGGGGWSVKKLRWQKYGPLGQVFYGAPGPLKLAVGGGLLAAAAPIGAAVDHWAPEEEFQ